MFLISYGRMFFIFILQKGYKINNRPINIIFLPSFEIRQQKNFIHLILLRKQGTKYIRTESLQICIKKCLENLETLSLITLHLLDNCDGYFGKLFIKKD